MLHVFRTHNEAMRRFVNWHDDCYECDPWYGVIGRPASSEGFDTIQFLHHDDQTCGNVAVEVVHTGADGSVPCPKLMFRKGLSQPCNCVPRPSSANVCLSCA